MTRLSQNAKILRALKRGAKLSHFTAERRFGCTRLAARINNLRNAGHQIVRVMLKTRTGGRFAVYSMKRG